jgi:uncharacterized protein (DUF488 family)
MKMKGDKGYPLSPFVMPLQVFTVGHSNRSLDAFIAILKAHGIERLADVRTIPRSRHNPQFNAEALEGSLREVGISYTRLPRLGGLRRPRKDSRNLAWRNDSFRGYADYMETADFETGLEELLALARKRRTAIMCAEALYYRCHRSLISDALVSRGVETVHLMSDTKTAEHRPTPFMKIENGRATYPAAQASLPHRGADSEE